MSEFLSLVKSVQDKCVRVISYADTLKTELAYRDQTVRELEQKVEDGEREIEALRDRIKKLETTDALVGVAPGGKEAKLKINEMVREIDRCIALLNK